MALQVKNSSKRNVAAIAFTSVGLGLCSGISHASIPAQGGIAAQLAQALGSRKMVVVHSNQVPGSGNSVTVNGTTTTTPTTASSTSPTLNTAAFSLGVRAFKGAIPMDQNTMSILADAQNAGGLISICQKLANPGGTGSFDDRCLLRQNHQGSGVVYGTLADANAAPSAGTNWNPASFSVPDAFMGSDRQLAMTDHLASYSAVTTDDLQKNYNVSVPNEYYKYWNGVTSDTAKNLGVPSPGFTSVWGEDERSVKFDNGATVTFKAGTAI